jgi:hypothetical protein
MKQEDIDDIAERILRSNYGKAYPREDCDRLMREDFLATIETIKRKVEQLHDKVIYDTEHDLQLRVWEDAMMKSTPAEISAETARLLDKIKPDIFTVRRFAKDITEAIAEEYRMKDGDMVSVIQTLGAVLAPLCDWLKGRGIILVKP